MRAMIAVIALTGLCHSTLAQDNKVGLNWPVYFDDTDALYFADYTDISVDPPCTEITPTYFWASKDAQPCPWENCPQDFVFPITFGGKPTGTFDKPMPFRLTDQTDMAQIINRDTATQRRTDLPAGQRDKDYNLKAGLNPTSYEDVCIQLPSGQQLAVRWFLFTPNRKAAGLRDEDIKRRGITLERPFRFGFELYKSTDGLRLIPATRFDQSNYQAHFSVGDNQKVAVITRTKLR